jgi:hypothetical protein
MVPNDELRALADAAAHQRLPERLEEMQPEYEIVASPWAAFSDLCAAGVFVPFEELVKHSGAERYAAAAWAQWAIKVRHGWDDTDAPERPQWLPPSDNATVDGNSLREIERHGGMAEVVRAFHEDWREPETEERIPTLEDLLTDALTQAEVLNQALADYMQATAAVLRELAHRAGAKV